MQSHTGDLSAVHSRQQKLTEFTKVLNRSTLLANGPALAGVINDKTGRKQDRAKGGRPPYSIQAILKISILQQLYGNLFGEEMENALLHRMSWPHFIGLTLVVRGLSGRRQ